MIKNFFKIFFLVFIFLFSFWLYENLDYETAFGKLPEILKFECSQETIRQELDSLNQCFDKEIVNLIKS